jgi:DNA-directed RNA polymerase subunit H (RpoH/RPB5)
MSLSSNNIMTIYNSRKTVLSQLEEQGYTIGDYDMFSINEIDAMYRTNQLDMLLTKKSDGKKAYVKYLIKIKQLRKDNLDQLVEDLYEVEQVLEKKDTLIVIVNEEPNDTIVTKIKYLYDHSGMFIVMHNIRRLQYDLLQHELVPYARIMTPEEVEELKLKYHISSISQLPEISRFDPQALALGLRPGEVIKIERKSNTAMNYNYYRYCL